MGEIKEIDFSEFHPLDHWIFEPRCWKWYGGVKQHIILWWNYQIDLNAKLRITFFCVRGKHVKTPYWTGKKFGEEVPPTGFMCTYCYTELVPNAEELAAKKKHIDNLLNKGNK